MPLFVLAVLAAGVGILGMARLARGHDLLPPRTVGRRHRSQWLDPRWATAALAAGLLVLVVTRWPAVALLAAALVVTGPRLAGGGARERRAVAKLEALAVWTETLRDIAKTASGLEAAIPRTLPSVPDLLERPVRHLTYRLSGYVPLPEALSLFADDVDDPGADMVVAALSLNARQRAGSLVRVLSTLARTTRAELDMRRTILHERNAVRRQAKQVAALALLLVVAQAVLSPQFVAPYGTGVGQVVLTVLAAAYLGLVLRLRALAEPEPEPRFLTTTDRVRPAASSPPRPTVAAMPTATGSHSGTPSAASGGHP
jgi:hypothetical protein